MIEFEVKQLGGDDYREWNEFVTQSPQGTIFHSSDWLLPYSRSYHLNLCILGCYENDNLVGGCPFFTQRYRHFFEIAFSEWLMNPYGGFILPYFAPNRVRDRENHEMRVFSSVCANLKDRGYLRVKLVNSPNLIDIRYFLTAGWDEKTRYTYHINLDTIALSRLAKRQMKKAQENGITVGFTREIDPYYELLRMTFHHQKMDVPISLESLRSIVKSLSDQEKAEIMIARTRTGDPVAGDIFIFDKKLVYRWSSASNPQLRQIGAHYQLLFEAFQHYHGKGFQTMDGMTGNIRRLGEFTTHFNPKLVPYYSLQMGHPLMKLLGLGMR